MSVEGFFGHTVVTIMARKRECMWIKMFPQCTNYTLITEINSYFTSSYFLAFSDDDPGDISASSIFLPLQFFMRRLHSSIRREFILHSAIFCFLITTSSSSPPFSQGLLDVWNVCVYTCVWIHHASTPKEGAMERTAYENNNVNKCSRSLSLSLGLAGGPKVIIMWASQREE